MDILSSLGYLLPPLIVAFCNLLLVAVVWRWSRGDFSNHLFVALLLSLTLWSSLLYSMRSSPNLHSALLWDRALPASTMLTFVLLYHFTIAYTNKDRHRKFIVFSYILLFIVVALSPTNLLIESMRLENYGYAPNVGIAARVIFLANPLLILGATYNFIKRYRVSNSQEERNRLVYLIIGTMFLLVGTFLDAFSNLPPVAIWTNLLFAIICSIAIVKYHLLDISIILRTGLVYLILSVFLAIPYLTVFYVLIVQLRIGIEAWWIHAVVILAAAIALRPLYTWAQRFVDRLFYRERYDYLIALEDFMQETHDITNLNEIVTSIVKYIRPVMQSSDVRLLLREERTDDFVQMPNDLPDDRKLRFSSHSIIVRWLIKNRRVLYVRQVAIIPQLQSLSMNDRIVLDNAKADLLIPIVTKEERLLGLIILGEKLSTLSYSKDDERLILAVANRIVGILENAYLFAAEKHLREEIEQQNEQKTEFLHSVAHELKTPLTAILSSSTLLSEESSIASDLYIRLASNVKQSALSMLRRVNELLNLAQIHVGELSMKSRPVEIIDFIIVILSQMRILFTNKRQTLTLEIPETLPKVNADPDKLEQVFFNLLANANKFSPRNSEVKIKASHVGSNIIIKIEDTAPPITDEERLRLFEPYYRGEDVDERQHYPGIGLGLTVAKKIVELHQGEIWVESKSNQGNIFAFSLPVLE